jgi:hypothetical protein
MSDKQQGVDITCGGCGNTQRIYMADHTRDMARDFAQMLDGTSPMFVYPPDECSPIGKCVNCGARFTCALFGYES